MDDSKPVFEPGDIADFLCEAFDYATPAPEQPGQEETVESMRALFEDHRNALTRVVDNPSAETSPAVRAALALLLAYYNIIATRSEGISKPNDFCELAGCVAQEVAGDVAKVISDM